VKIEAVMCQATGDPIDRAGLALSRGGLPVCYRAIESQPVDIRRIVIPNVPGTMARKLAANVDRKGAPAILAILP
jgi:hypothetical protein